MANAIPDEQNDVATRIAQRTLAERSEENANLHRTVQEQASVIRELERVVKVISGEGEALIDEDAPTLPPHVAADVKPSPPAAGAPGAG